MGVRRKRKIHEEDGEKPKGKIPKQDGDEVEEKMQKKNVKKETDFDVKHFRKEIKSKTGQTVPLVQFLQVCLNTNSGADYLKQYLDSGGNANEILRQLDEESKKNPLVVSPVFNLLHLMFTAIQSSHPEYLQQAQETCRYFLNTYISTIDFMLSEKSNARQQKITLQLLTTIVTLNSELAFTVLNQLSLQPKMLLHLVKMQNNVKEKDDVRKSFILFLMSFLLDGNTTLIKALLDKNGLLALIMPDLVRDSIEIVHTVLELLKKNVISNQSISKTIKIRTFNQPFLSNIFNLFNWKVCNLKTEEGLKSKYEVEDSVFEFLVTLFTSHKHGLYFADKYLGTGDTPTNQHLWKAIENLEAPWGNEKAGELIIKIISTCPDLNKPILHLVEQSFEPRHSEQWLKCVKFLTNVFNSLPAKHVISLMTDMNPVQIINFVRNVYLPSKILQVCNTTLNGTDVALKNQIISLLKIMLSSVKAFLVQMDLADENLVKVKALLKNRLEDFIPKHFPSTDLLISVLHSVLDSESANAAAENSTEFRIPSPKNSTLVISILDLLLMYNDILPNSLDPIATMLDSKRLLERVETLGDKYDIGELKLKIIMFLLGADKFAFAPEKPLFKEILHSMFEVYITSESKISESARDVLCRILETTGIFERNVSEIDLLLSVVKVVGRDYQNVVGHIVEVVESVLKHLPKYSEYIATACKVNDNDSSYKEYVDIYFEHLDTEEELTTETISTVEKSSCTPFVIGVLKHKNSSDLDFSHFSKYFLISLYHNQESPEHLCTILKEYTLDSCVSKYISNWTNKSTKLTGKLVDKNSVLYKLSNILVQDEETIYLNDVFELSINEDDNTANIFIMNGQTYAFSPEKCTPYINQCVDMILFYIVQQNNLNELNSNKVDNSLKALNCLMSMNVSTAVEDVRKIQNIIEKCLTHRILIQKFSPFKKNDLLTKFIYDVIFLSKNKFETNFLSSLLKPYRHKLYLSLMVEIKQCNESKHGVILNEVTSFLSTIDLMYSDANSVVRELLKMDVSCMVTNENETSSWIHVLCYVIKLFTKNSTPFSHRTIQGISLLYFKMITNLNVVINLQEFEECYLNYLRSNPDCILNVPHKVFKAIFSIKHVSKCTSNLGALLLKTDVRLLPFFKTNVVKDETIQKRELILPLTNAAFCHNVFATNTNLIKQIYDVYKPNIIKILEKPHKASQIYVDYSELIVKLINKCMDVKECEDFCKKTLKCESLECFHVDLIEEIYFKAYFATQNALYLNNLLLCILQLVNVSFKKDNPAPEKLVRVANTVQKILLICHNDNIKCDSFASVCNSPTFQSFFKSVLKTFIKTEQSERNDTEPCLFSLTSSLIHATFPKDHEAILNMFEMTTSHSEFLNVMLSNRQTNVKTQLVKLLLVMASNNKEVMKSTHLPVYLSSYHASMKQCDRYLLCLLKLYESNGHSLNEYQPYLWGDTAANHYAVRSKRTKSSLWSNPTANHILNLLDKEMIERTIKDFPMNATLNTDEKIQSDIDFLFGIDAKEMYETENGIFSKIYVKNQDVQTNSVDLNVDIVKSKIVMKNLIETSHSRRRFDSDIYDPAFILPLLNFVVIPGSAVSCHRIIRGGILSIPFIALSSNCTSVRAAAFNILHRFYTLLETEMYYRNDKVLWSQFIDTLKSSLDSIDSPSSYDSSLTIPKLPTTGALYLARSALIMTHPLDPMFKPINNFIISKQYINFTVIPDFLDIFHNTDVTFIERRTWMLKLLRDSIKITDDIDVVLKSVAFKMILDFYSSSLCDVRQKVLTLEILNTCILIPKTAKLMVEGFGLIAWLSNVFKDMNPESKKIVTISVHLVSNLWTSLSLEANKSVHVKMAEEINDAIFREILSGKCLKLGDTLQNHILNLLVDLSSKLSYISACDMKVYLNVLNKMSKSCLKNVSSREMLSLLNVIVNLYSDNVVVKALKSIVIDNRKDCWFNNVTIDELSCGNEEERCVVKYLHSCISKWFL